ncbi:MAG: prepilin peptidase [Planctomycetia bacterium]|nr:prepilin peptidase [Planctomycetia bacterium]
MTGDLVPWGASPAGGVAACVGGWLLGHLLARAVDGWFRATDDGRVSRRAAAGVATASACVACLLWWWEVRLGGQLPAGVSADVVADPRDLAARCLAHAVLFWLLAAAAWIDLRQRVIPDWITTPGTILGLCASWAWPGLLLPIAVEIPRSFAAPLLRLDGLAWHGGLHAGASGPFAAAPHAGGLVLAVALFAGWWVVCTDPGPEGPVGRPVGRFVILGLGQVAIAAAWWCGTMRFDALVTALMGAGVSGGLVWATRAGASWALGREAMGLGDVTLMALAGAWLGWQACVLAFFAAAFIGLAHGVGQFVRHRENELPFGPSLCLATALVVVAWRPAWVISAEHFARPGQLAAVVAAVVVLTAVTLLAWRGLRAGA